jgi:hypothetical protein
MSSGMIVIQKKKKWSKPFPLISPKNKEIVMGTAAQLVSSSPRCVMKEQIEVVD